ncbi:MAG TPA: glycosyltransferase [Candidatus Eremiobacteraeota bacterium]|nr:glycosyltransferase [Candidatus Eremiobacteraeota bacterium]
MSQPTLSLAMIVKNEEYNIYTCLKQVEDLVDEIIIVDTGSTDNTLKVLNQFPVTLYHYKWDDDFSSARNYSISKCTCNWILILDADEFIDSTLKYMVRELIKTKDFVGFEFEQFTYLSNDITPEFRIEPVLRLFPNHSSLRFRYSIQEKLICNNPELEFKHIYSGIRLWHYGYMQQNYQSREKYNRNLQVYLKNLLLKPEDSLEHFFTGLQYYYLHKYKDALNHIKLAIKYGSKDITYYPYFFTMGAAILTKLDLYKDARNMCEEAISIDPSIGEAYFNAGETMRNLRDYTGAIIMLEKAISSEDKNYYFFQDRSKTGWKAYSEMAICYVQLKEMEKARDALLKALNLKPFYSPLMVSLAYLYKELDDLPEAEKYFQAVYEQEFNRFSIAYELYEIYKQTGRINLAASILEKLYFYNKENPTLLLDIARTFYEAGDNIKAINYYSQYLEDFPDSPSEEIYLRRGVCFFREGLTKKARSDFNRSRKKNPHLLRKVFLDELVK